MGSSVVPALSQLIRQACLRFLDMPPLLAPEDLAHSPGNRYVPVPRKWARTGWWAPLPPAVFMPDPPSLISVDFGTATTFDCVSGNAYLGGLICPGVLSVAALSSRTASCRISGWMNPSPWWAAPRL